MSVWGKVGVMPNADARRILILSASAGSGHVRAAEALETVFGSDPRVGEVLHIDALWEEIDVAEHTRARRPRRHR